MILKLLKYVRPHAICFVFQSPDSDVSAERWTFKWRAFALPYCKCISASYEVYWILFSVLWSQIWIVLVHSVPSTILEFADVFTATEKSYWQRQLSFCREGYDADRGKWTYSISSTVVWGKCVNTSWLFSILGDDVCMPAVSNQQHQTTISRLRPVSP